MTVDNGQQKSIERKVSAALASLDRMPKLRADDFFYARLRQRLNRADESPAGWPVPALLGGRLAPVLLVAMILLNLATAYVTLSGHKDASYREQGIESLADQYLLGVSDFVSATKSE